VGAWLCMRGTLSWAIEAAFLVDEAVTMTN